MRLEDVVGTCCLDRVTLVILQVGLASAEFLEEGVDTVRTAWTFLGTVAKCGSLHSHDLLGRGLGCAVGPDKVSVSDFGDLTIVSHLPLEGLDLVLTDEALFTEGIGTTA